MKFWNWSTVVWDLNPRGFLQGELYFVFKKSIADFWTFHFLTRKPNAEVGGQGNKSAGPWSWAEASSDDSVFTDFWSLLSAEWLSLSYSPSFTLAVVKLLVGESPRAGSRFPVGTVSPQARWMLSDPVFSLVCDIWGMADASESPLHRTSPGFIILTLASTFLRVHVVPCFFPRCWQCPLWPGLDDVSSSLPLPAAHYWLIYFWLRRVFTALCGLSLVAASGGCSWLRGTGFTWWQPLLLLSTGCRHVAFSCCSTRAQ